jgi:hypothetical protein
MLLKELLVDSDPENQVVVSYYYCSVCGIIYSTTGEPVVALSSEENSFFSTDTDFLFPSQS